MWWEQKSVDSRRVLLKSPTVARPRLGSPENEQPGAEAADFPLLVLGGLGKPLLTGRHDKWLGFSAESSQENGCVP